jgi:hypothetical protein
MRRHLGRLTMTAVLGVVAAYLSVLSPTVPTAAAATGTFQQVTSFGSNPGNLQTLGHHRAVR